MRATFLFLITFGLFFLNWSCTDCDDPHIKTEMENLQIEEINGGKYEPGDTIYDELEIVIDYERREIAGLTSFSSAVYATPPCDPRRDFLSFDSVFVISNGQKMDSLLRIEYAFPSDLIPGTIEFLGSSKLNVTLFKRPEQDQTMNLSIEFYEESGDLEKIELGKFIIKGQ